MIAGGGKDAHTLLEKRRGGRSKIGQRIRGGAPKSQQSSRGDGLTEAPHGLAVRKREYFHGTAEDGAGQRSESRRRVAYPGLQSGRIDPDDLLKSGIEPDRCSAGEQRAARGP